ncbi:hypothetical protein [Streptosporangium sp. NPDC051022]|uniref:hypothetical protein n=1 Tax=Streptosporangium sp. NPDC051022 TaxID=3155752 RepID=UPI00343FE467
MKGLAGLGGPSALEKAESLRVTLALRGINADVMGDHSLALVSVWAGLTVWCNGLFFWWHVDWNPTTRRARYTGHPVPEFERVVEQVTRRYTDLRQQQASPSTALHPYRGDHGPR